MRMIAPLPPSRPPRTAISRARIESERKEKRVSRPPPRRRGEIAIRIAPDDSERVFYNTLRVSAAGVLPRIIAACYRPPVPAPFPVGVGRYADGLRKC